MTTPRFACALSTEKDSARALGEALENLDAGLEGEAPDLAVAFATHHHGTALEDLGPRLANASGAPVVVGCTAESVIGGRREVERSPGLALWAARLPGTDVRFFELDAAPGPAGEGHESPPTFSPLPPVGDPGSSSILLVADPYTFPVDAFLGVLNERFPGVPAMGGMASGAMGPGQSLLFTSEGVRESGCAGVVLEGDVELRPVVSQGCRPIGKPWVITACEENRIQALGGRPALEVLMETWHGLAPEDQALLQSAPFLGLAIDPSRSTFERGDFLVRGIMGLHQKERAIAVADYVRRGQTIQLLVRDAASAGEDLRCLMEAQGGGAVEGGAAGALIFSCNGRGTRMFGEPDHDVGRVHAGLESEVPVAGFFAAGEIGPVGGRNFLHGFTASVAVFRSRSGG
jgi:small ligand-binding sensory domain FIST